MVNASVRTLSFERGEPRGRTMIVIGHAWIARRQEDYV